jgi:hypothetical protein
MYNGLQYGHLHRFPSIAAVLVCCGLLLAPFQLGAPSLFEVIGHFCHGQIEIGVFFSLVALMVLTSGILVIVSIVKTVVNGGELFEIGDVTSV